MKDIISLKLTEPQLQKLLYEVFDVPLDLWYKIKVEKAIKKQIIDVQAIRAYIPELNKEINSCVERGERPRLLIKRTLRAKTQTPEIEIVFYGNATQRHIEELSYFTKPPQQWTTWGEIVLTLGEARRIQRFLKELLAETEQRTL